MVTRHLKNITPKYLNIIYEKIKSSGEDGNKKNDDDDNDDVNGLVECYYKQMESIMLLFSVKKAKYFWDQVVFLQLYKPHYEMTHVVVFSKTCSNKYLCRYCGFGVSDVRRYFYNLNMLFSSFLILK